jgi:hypothetical protein
MSEWISINDRLPENDMCVLVTNRKGWMHKVQAIYYKHKNFFLYDNPDVKENLLLDVTHWLEIPGPPN